MSTRPCRRAVAVALLALFWSLASYAQSIFTFAGGGTTDGRQATDIGLFGVSGIAFDGKGNLYISEAQRHVIQRVNLSTGVIEVFAGNGGGSFGGDDGPARRASLMQPRGITFDDAGNLYIADNGNDRIRKVEAQTGTITTFAGGGQESPNNGDGGQAAAATVDGPMGVDWHQGSLYITQSSSGGLVRRVAADGIITTLAGGDRNGFEGDGGLAKDALLSEPFGIVVDGAGNIFVADGANAAVRRIDAATGKIETIVGRGTPADEIGDNLPGTQAKLVRPTGLALDAAGRLYIADAYNTYGRIRRWDPTSKIVTTVVGNGQYHEGDGGPVSGAGLYAPFAVAIDADQNLYVHDGANESIRVVGAASQIINRIAGGGSFIGDGLLAKSAILRGPRGLALDAAGNLFIADSNETLVRKVDATTGIISTFAGRLYEFYAGGDQDGKLAIEGVVGAATDVAVKGVEVFIADPHNGKIWRVDAEGKIFTYAGGGAEGALGDDGNAVGATINPQGISFDTAGNLYIADVNGSDRHRIRKVDAGTKIITTVAGSATGGFSGDDGQATAAQLQYPVHALADAAGNLFIADKDNGAIRRVDAVTKVITTYAGRGNPADGIGDGLLATEASLTPAHMAIDITTGDLYVADPGTHRIRKIDARSKVITTVAGSGTSYLDADFSGDNGPATAAKMNFQYDISGVARDAKGNLYIGDTLNNRVRAVLACGTVSAPQLSQPANNTTGASSAPTLSWNAVTGAFRYDVFLDTVADPQAIVASDTDETRFTPANLAPGTKYYWKVRAKGDPFCAATSATSAVFSFTTAAGCGVGAFDLTSPSNNATNVSSPVTLSWQAAAGAASYDVYLGTVSPPPLFQSGVTQTSLQVTPGQGTNYWTVVARAACDSAKTSTAPVRSFTVQSTACNGPAAVELLSPAPSATGVATGTTLTWRATGCATAPFDVYFGTAADPPLLSANVAGTSQVVNALAPSTRYYWRVVGTNRNGGAVNSNTVSFTTQACAAPGATSITFAPSSVALGTTYAIVWQQAADLDPLGGYLVERSTNASFAGAESQITTSTSATYIADRTGTLYHRVRAVPSCDPRQAGPVSQTRAIVVTAARPNVIFTVQPSAVVVGVGDRLEEIRSSFTLENLGTDSVRVGVGRQELGSSPPFFSIFDPLGNDIFVTLEPRKPRTFQVRYGGPSTASPGSYQGVIYVAGESLAIIPYAFVELRVGEEGSATPRFEVGGSVAEFVSIPGHTGDASVEVGIRNTGTSPMELAAEVGPEVWLVPEKGWNDSEIGPGTLRTIKLNTRRAFAPNGSPLPRYTYLTVRTKSGATARLLVQDNDAAAAGNGRPIALRADERSFIVPEATSRTAVPAGLLVTRLRLTNAGSDAVQAELLFTPASTDGFAAQGVKRATVVVPPNDVVTLTDPLVQVLSLARPASGQLEVRVPRERLGLVTVRAATVALTGGAGVELPTLVRGAGARRGATHVVHGLTHDASTTSSLVLVETSGIAGATVKVRLYELNGTPRQEATYSLLRYGYRRIDDILPALGVNEGRSMRLDVTVESGEGSVVAVGIVRDRPSERGVAFVSSPVVEQSSTSNLIRSIERGEPDPPSANALPNITIVVPVLGSPSGTGGAAIPSYKTLLQFISGGGSSVFNMAFRGSDGATQKTLPALTVPSGLSVVFEDSVAGLFGLAAGSVGSVRIEATNGGKVSAVLQTAPTPSAKAVASSTLPLLSSASEVLTGATLGSQRPLFLDGLEQSTDPAVGSRWLLVLNEVAGAGGTVTVRLFESGNRTQPIASKDVALGPYQQLTLDTIFGQLGLETAERKKDRTNVQVVVMASTGSAKVAASAVSVDNRSGETKVHELLPGGFGSSIVSAITPTLPAAGKGRAVRHP